jgi:predicted RNase H-related nuclease YkuK (DUF458 family)
MEEKGILWKRVSHGVINESLIDYLEGLVEEQYDLGNKVKICIGTDSQKKGKGYKYAVAIIFEMKKPMGLERGIMTYKGMGAKVISGTFVEKYRPSLQERMLKEVQLSIDVAYGILPLLELYEIDFEIHADVNPDPLAGSHVALTEAMGFIKGMGFNCKVKPEAYAASSGADKLCNG